MAQNTIVHNYLTVVMPDDWEDASQVIVKGPEDGGFSPNLVFSQEPCRAGEDAQAFAMRQLPLLSDALDGYEVVSEEPASFGANKGYLRLHTFSMEKGEIAQFQFYVINRNRAYTFTFTHLRNKFDDIRDLAEDLFSQASLRL